MPYIYQYIGRFNAIKYHRNKYNLFYLIRKQSFKTEMARIIRILQILKKTHIANVQLANLIAIFVHENRIFGWKVFKSALASGKSENILFVKII